MELHFAELLMLNAVRTTGHWLCRWMKMVSEGQLVDLPRSKMFISWYFEVILTVGRGLLLAIIAPLQ